MSSFIYKCTLMKFIIFPIFAASLLSLASCSKTASETSLPPDPVPPIETRKVPEITYDVTQLAYCNLFETAAKVTQMQRQDYNELSGIASSRRNSDILYMHNDGKNTPIIISNALGQDLGKIIIDGHSTVDTEDISVGPGPEAGKSYIYLADTGDNNNTRASITIYRFEEPVLNNPTANTEIHISQVSKIVLKYPSSAYNCETLLVDPLTKDIFIATKEVNRSTVFRAAYPQSELNTIIMEPVLNMRFFDLLTAGDISEDGKEILLRNKGQIWYWTRNTAKSIADALQEAPQRAPYAGNEHQGEGIGFAQGNTGYFTNTEIRDYPGTVSNISFYKRK